MVLNFCLKVISDNILLCHKCPTVQMPSRKNLCRTQTAVEFLQSDQAQPGGRPPSGSPAKQAPVSSIFSKLWRCETHFTFNSSMICYMIHSYTVCHYSEESLLFSVSGNLEDRPPPLPTQKPVGDLGRQGSAFKVRFSWLLCEYFKHKPFVNSEGLNTFQKWFSQYRNTCQGSCQEIWSLTKTTWISCWTLTLCKSTAVWLTLFFSCIHQQRNCCWPINRFCSHCADGILANLGHI